MPQSDVNSCLTRWVAFLEQGSPCGEDLEFEPEFESLQEEVGRDSSIHADRPTDWSIVFQQADGLFLRSKDLWLFAYGIIALYHTQGLNSSAEGLTAMAAFLAEGWDNAYPLPKRIARRLAPLKWLRGRLAQYAENTGFIGEAPEAVQACAVAVRALQSLLDEKVPDNGLAFDALFSNLDGNAVAGRAEAETSKQAPPAQAAPVSRPAQAAPAATASVSSAPDKDGRIPAGTLPQIIRACNDTARQMGDHLISISSSDERGYLLHRVGCWGTLLQLPPVDGQQRTQLVCPVEQDRLDGYTAAIEEKRYGDVLAAIEKTASKAPFWLDGHYMVARCLEGLGASAAAACVKHTLALLLNRFPALTDYKFKDGKAFASPKTAAWLDTAVQSAFAAGSQTAAARGTASGKGEADADELLLQEALRLNSEKGFEAGMEHLGAVPPGRSRMAVGHSLLKARYCLAAGKKNAARNILENIFNDLEKWELFDWEPELSATVISLLLSCVPKAQDNDRAILLSMLYKYNVTEALKVAPA